ncbi:MAG TPA: protein kinase [Terriglobales bacterium]|nr:protein kinase [Terriglobales bacterium]
METKEQWSRIKELFGAALERDPRQRAQFLREACRDDESLRQEIESLLEAHDSSSELSQHPWSLRAQESASPHNIGPYHLIEKIGEGGMGQVWLAEQTSPIHRRVALKLIRWGVYDDAVIHRFQAERQSLAVMDHPSIAKVFDAGATPEGQPYFVMEYVPGVPITDYCDQKKLKIRDRLELFRRVCEGVQHAHQKAIIHRDLKPANILVAEIDGKPVPRIIDFGLAKALDSTSAEDSFLTRAGSFVGTPGYMSPEQCDPAGQDIDTRTDVYSLGVVLYVLLTGVPPFDSEAWKKKPFHEMMRVLREQDPPRPSTKLGIDPATSIARAESRSSEPKQLSNLLRGDLDWITMKAVERDRSRRYRTPSELADDINHYLRHEPVTARPASLTYRARKYVRRHRVGVGIAAMLAVLLVGFAVAQTMQLQKTIRERDRADRIAEFMTGIFKISDPNEKPGGNATARELLDKAAKEINTGLAKDPELKTSMMHVIGRAYMYQGLYARAQSMFEGGIGAANAAGAQKDRETLLTAHDLAWSLLQQGHIAEAEKVERELVATQTRTFGPDDRDTLASKSELAFTLCQENKCAEGVRLNAEVLEKQKRILGAEAHATLITMDNQAIMLAESGQPAEAEQLQLQALQLQLKVDGEKDLSTVHAMLNLGDFQRDQHHDEDAEKSLRHAIEVAQRVLGPNQPETASAKYDLATVLARNDRKDEAFSLLRDSVDHGLAPRIALDMKNDPLLVPLHGDPRFSALVAHVQERTGAQAPD